VTPFNVPVEGDDVFDLTPYQEEWNRLQALEQLVKERDQMKKRFKELAGNRTVFALNGKVVRRFEADGKFQVGKLRDEHPHLYDMFLAKQECLVFDEARFKQVYPDLWQQMRSRSMRAPKKED